MVSQPLTNGPKKKPLTGCLFYYGCLSGDATPPAAWWAGCRASVPLFAPRRHSSTGEVPAAGRGGRGNKRCFSSCSSCVRTLGRAVRSSDGGRRVDLCSTQAAIRHRQVREGGRGAREEEDEGWRAAKVPIQGRQAHTHTQQLTN